MSDKKKFDEALDAQMEEALAKPEVQPVHVSGEAQHQLAMKLRQWSGWADATLVLDNPENVPDSEKLSDAAMVDKDTHTFYANPDVLVLNPNRVLYTITPFRLRQEAVLTGALLHECGHARFSNWHEPGSPAVHGDGSPVNKQTMSLARLMEEPRVEGHIAKMSPFIGASDLDWTMRACAHELLPMTKVSREPGQAVLDFITSWALRAGRELALAYHTDHKAPRWAVQFNNLLEEVLLEHLDNTPNISNPAPSAVRASHVLTSLIAMSRSDFHTGSWMVDTAREILAELFPDQDGDAEGAPMAGGTCVVQAQGEQGDTSDESDESDGADDQPGSEVMKALAEALSGMEDKAAVEADKEEAEKKSQSAEGSGGKEGGIGSGGPHVGEWRTPDKTEREIAKGAERFLRGLIAPTETSKVMLTDQPSATVDGAALAAWKAGGQVRDPLFFKRTKRHIQPAPPVDVAALVDISGSMEELQEPSAVLSWALASAALDLRNFAGRGQQVRSCLIHWGDHAEVIQGPGKLLPGIRSVACNDGTSALIPAMDLIEQEMPGFFDEDNTAHRLIVHFTDWELSYHVRNDARDRVRKALEAGVNMVTVAPRTYSPGRSLLSDLSRMEGETRGVNSVFKYDLSEPMSVWDHAAEALS